MIVLVELGSKGSLWMKQRLFSTFLGQAHMSYVVSIIWRNISKWCCVTMKEMKRKRQWCSDDGNSRCRAVGDEDDETKIAHIYRIPYQRPVKLSHIHISQQSKIQCTSPCKIGKIELTSTYVLPQKSLSTWQKGITFFWKLVRKKAMHCLVGSLLLSIEKGAQPVNSKGWKKSFFLASMQRQ